MELKRVGGAVERHARAFGERDFHAIEQGLRLAAIGNVDLAVRRA